MSVWNLADAEAHLGEIIELASTQGPQLISRRGEPAAVLLSVQEYDRLSQPRPSFKEYLSSGPLGDLEIERLNTGWREIDL